jgi:hypothetical protein
LSVAPVYLSEHKTVFQSAGASILGNEYVTKKKKINENIGSENEEK